MDDATEAPDSVSLSTNARELAMSRPGLARASHGFHVPAALHTLAEWLSPHPWQTWL